MSDPEVPAPDELPLAILMGLARREVEDDDGDVPMPALSALHRRPSRDVFDHAVAIVDDSDAIRRQLGVRILRELGDEQPDGRRPFREQTVSLMRARLRDETDPAVVHWIVSALGYHRGREALAEVVALAGHPDDWVRFHVAAALPSLVDLDDVEPEAVDALIRLCHDEDAETRFYALYAVTREIAGFDVAMVLRLTEQLVDDPDEQVRAMAAAHREAIHELRELLGNAAEQGKTGLGSVGPGSGGPVADELGTAGSETAGGVHDDLIGPILVALACAGDAADAGPWLGEEIRRRGGPLHIAGIADRLVTWWREHELDRAH